MIWALAKVWIAFATALPRPSPSSHLGSQSFAIATAGGGLTPLLMGSCSKICSKPSGRCSFCWRASVGRQLESELVEDSLTLRGRRT